MENETRNLIVWNKLFKYANNNYLIRWKQEKSILHTIKLIFK